MSIVQISILVGILTFFIFNIAENLILGDRGKDNQISNYFKYIRENNNIKNKDISKNISMNYSKKEYIIRAIPICIGIFILMYISSRLIELSFLISILGLLYPKALVNNKLKRREQLLNNQFRDALNSIVSSLKAGLSINSALIKCADDLENLYSLLKDKPMLNEFKKIKSDLNMGMPVDDVLIDFMNRIENDDVCDFVNSVIIVRQKGGNLVEVMDNVNRMIADKNEIKREIEILTVSKRMEADILTIVPIVVIVFLSIFSKSYISSLYDSFIGKIFIVIGLVCLVINYYISRKIVDIKI